MSFRRSAVATVIILPILLLTACHPEGPDATPPGMPSSNGASASPSPSAAASDLPVDALLGVSGTVTADNGAKLALTLVVHSSTAATAPEAAPRMTALTDKCSGEVDAALLTSSAYGLLQVDYSAVLVGSTAWPTDLPLLVLPTAKGVPLASAGGVAQIAFLPAPFEAGDYVPHCAQNAFLAGPGSGSTFLAFAGDASDTPPLTRWADFPYGFTVNSPAGFVGTTAFGGINPQRVTFSGCATTLTALAPTLGYPSSSWSEEFAKDHCAVGGGSQSLGGK